MSVAGKQNLMRRIEASLRDVLTVSQSEAVLAAIADQIARFDVAEMEDPCEDHNQELLDAFIAAKEVEGRSPKTIALYRYRINQLCKDLGVPLQDVTVYHIRQWLAKEKARGVSESTLNSDRDTYSSFFGWLTKEGLIASNPMTNIGPIKVPKVTRLPFSPVDIERLKECCTNDRDKAIICFLLSTGCRVSEVTALNRNDVDFEHRRVLVTGKGNKQRTVFIDEVTAAILARYLAGRKDDSVALFHSKSSPRMQPHGVRAMLKRLEAVSGVQNVHPHRFRRTLATNLINRGMTIQDVAAILGHERLDTTMKYVYIDTRSVQNAYSKFAS